MKRLFLLICFIWAFGENDAFCGKLEADIGNTGSVDNRIVDKSHSLEAPKVKQNSYSSSGYRKIDLRQKVGSKPPTEQAVANPAARQPKKQVVREPAGIPSLNRIRPSTPPQK